MSDPSQGAAPPGAPPGAGGQPPPPNFFDPKPFANYTSTILGVTITLLSFCYLAISARLWVRLVITKTPGWDDLFVVLALLMVSVGTISFCLATRYGMGQHIYLIPPQDIASFLICFWIDAASYNSSTALIKVSLLFQYLRIFDRGTYTYRFTQFLLIFVGVWGCVFSFMAWFPCLPHIDALWKDPARRGCYSGAAPNPATSLKWIEAHAGFNMGFDILVLTLAFRLVFRREARSTLLGMLILLFMGVVSCMFAIWRLVEIVRSKAGVSSDISWNLAGPTLLSLCEIYIATLSASVPFFWPLITKSLDKIFVAHDFAVTTTSRYNDEENVELARSETWQSNPKSITPRENASSLSARSREMVGVHQNSKEASAHYVDDFNQAGADPFAEDFRTEAAVETGLKSKKKGGFVRFKNPGA